MFPFPALADPNSSAISAYYPVASYSFGWIDSIAISIAPPEFQRGDTPQRQPYPDISILLRAESDNPWSSNIHRLRRYSLSPNPLYLGPSTPSSSIPRRRDINAYLNPDDGLHYDPECPYLFPPKPTAHIPALRGFLRCADVALGDCGSALWVQPRPRTARTGLTSIDVGIAEQFLENDHATPTLNGNGGGGDGNEVPQYLNPNQQAAGARALMVNFREECLCAVIFPGPLSRGQLQQIDAGSPVAPTGHHSVGTSSNLVVNGTGILGEAQALIHPHVAPQAQLNADDAPNQTGPPTPSSPQDIRGRRLWVNNGASWTSMDYDEGNGRIALGASDGSVTMLFM